MKVGDEIEATVVKTDDGEGNIKLSKRSGTGAGLGYTQRLHGREQEYQVKISEIVKASAVAFVEGIRGFIPASQLSLTYVEDLEPWLGRELEVQVITVDEGKEQAGSLRQGN